MTTLRFAPSPTGALHIGNARTGLIAWLEARRRGGRIVLRCDDTDRARSSAAAWAAIEADLAWLGLDFDRRIVQSERYALYEERFSALRDAGSVYPCYETAAELETRRKSRLKRGAPPRYDRAALELTEAERARLEAEGRRPHWRFRIDDARLERGDFDFEDGGYGHRRAQGGEQSDPVIRLEDGRPTYHFASVVDDAEAGVDLVIRGSDHLSATHVQIALFRAIGAPVPRFHHLPLVHGLDGKKLSKRAGGAELSAYRALEPEALAATLAGLGRSEPPPAATSLEDLVPWHRLEAYGTSAPRFEPRSVDRLNAKVLAALNAEQAAARLGSAIDPGLWDAVKDNLDLLRDVEDWRMRIERPLTPAIETADRVFLEEAAAALPDSLDAASAETWLSALKSGSGRKGKALFLPLRRALTGLDHGPNLVSLLPLLGRSRAHARLMGERA